MLGVLGIRQSFLFSVHNLALAIIGIVVGSVRTVFITVSVPIVIVENVAAVTPAVIDTILRGIGTPAA